MWRSESKQYEENTMPDIIKFTGDNTLYGAAMKRVIYEWPTACENFLSNASINRRAYLGHAACCLERNYPEYLVRKAWGLLQPMQRALADAQATKYIKVWEKNQRLKATLKNGKTDAIRAASPTAYQLKLMT